MTTPSTKAVEAKTQGTASTNTVEAKQDSKNLSVAGGVLVSSEAAPQRDQELLSWAIKVQERA